MDDHGSRSNADGGGGGGSSRIRKLSSSASMVKLMCSYGGKIQPRPRGNKLMYVGGDTKVLTVDRNIKFSDIVKKLNSLNGEIEVGHIKYQLPGEDLDVLISIVNQEDLDNMMYEYDVLHSIFSPKKPVRIRLFIFSVEKPANLSCNSGLGAPLNPDYLFGFDKEYDCNDVSNSQVPQTSSPSETAFDLELWKIPIESRRKTEVHKVAAQDSHMTRCVAGQQVVYPIPAVSLGLQLRQYGTQGMVKMGVINGCRQQPIYNFVPPEPSMPEQMKIVMTRIYMS